MAKAFINGLPAGGGEQTAPPADIPAGSRVLLEIYLLEHLLRPLENRVFNLESALAKAQAEIAAQAALIAKLKQGDEDITSDAQQVGFELPGVKDSTLLTCNGSLWSSDRGDKFGC